ncbi:MAG: flavodoxin family protein [Syntrophobacteraceae bacterium]
MKVMAINGSPRKKWNTATLLENALAGSKAGGAETEIAHLYSLSYKGCNSCFACKKIGGKSYARCAVRDELTPVLERAAEADALILGSPMYFCTETGEMRSFMERLMFPYLTYTPGYASIFPRKMPIGLIYTMNMPEDEMPTFGQDKTIARTRWVLAHIFGSCEVLLSSDTYQFKDYTKYLSTAFDEKAKARRRKEVFPQDCARAYKLGERLVSGAGKQ